jgi:hypothetical protein
LLTALLLAVALTGADDSGRPAGDEAAPVHDLAKLAPDPPLVGRPGRSVFVPGSRPDDVLGFWAVEADGPDDVVRVVHFAPGEDDAGLHDADPIVVEGLLMQLHHPARDDFVAVELRLVEARRVR